MHICAQFRLSEDSPISFRPHIEKLYSIVEALRNTDTYSREWLLTGSTEKDAYLYSVFDENGAMTKAAEAVLETKFKNEKSHRMISIWNGEQEKSKGASISYRYTSDSIHSEINIDFPETIEGARKLGDLDAIHHLVNILVQQWAPLAIAIGPYFYFDKQVFKDRLGVGWMLYLPKILITQQVPEARALIPVMEGKKQKGTIIVSVVDEPFDVNNKEHIEIANAIEIRLVDQDLLPRYADL